ncbi:ABC transporter substrate-binding protein [Rhodomicrobium sp. R_RK_3]|nr:ABC transporter substrate-binding protein [Rhodomicrobium sp. R_RK_3]
MTAALALAGALAGGAALAQDIAVGHLADQSGPTSDVGVPYGQGVADALAYINSKGGIAGKKLAVETVDYGYQVPRAVAQYKKWSEGTKVAAIQGWGTADTEAMIGFVTKDQIPYLSASYSAALTDPGGKSGRTKAAPYNFFYGPSYSDAVRALLIWAAEDWKAKGGTGKPKFVHMGANHPYPNSPKEAGEAMAKELGFDIIPPVQFAMTPGDYTSQCLTIKDAGANYAYLANTAGSNISVLKACKTAGVNVQFMGNVWGMDENAAKAAGDAANGVVFPMRTGIAWNGEAPGKATLAAISKLSSGGADVYRPVHYLTGVCSAYYMAEAMDWAAKNGGVTGPNVQQGMYQKKDWVPAGMEGVCLPSSWSAEDHRGLMSVNIYRMNVGGATEAPVADLVKNGTIKLEKVKTVELERKADRLGW